MMSKTTRQLSDCTTLLRLLNIEFISSCTTTLRLSLLLHLLRMQVTDGAAACLMMTRGEAIRRGLPILGIFRSFTAVGVDPAIMGVGPAVAIPAAVEKVRLLPL